MDITSVKVGRTSVVRQSNMGEYGKVYSTARFSYNPDRLSGTYTGQGRGIIDENTMLSGFGMGIWKRRDQRFTWKSL